MLRRLVLRRVTRYSPPVRPTRCLATAAPPSPNDAFANGTNAYYVEEMYKHWRQDPKSVHVSWDTYFSGMDKGLPSQQAFQPPPTFLPQPVGGAPTLDAGRGAKLDDHLKVNINAVMICLVSETHIKCHPPGSTSCSRIPSQRAPRCGSRSPWYP